MVLHRAEFALGPSGNSLPLAARPPSKDAKRAMSSVVTFCLLVGWICPGSDAFSLPVDVTSYELNHQNHTFGVSGVKCTKIDRRCLTGVECVDHQCICPNGTKGNGEIECVDEDNFLCEVSADPHLHTYSGARADVDLPCRYRLTRFVTDHRTAATPHAFCAVEVYATNELNMGYYYVRSVHVSLGITDSGQQTHSQFEVRKFGITEDKLFKFYTNLRKTKALWGFSLHEVINEVDVFPTFDEENNFAVLWVPQCATRIKYRAYNRTKHRQHLLPGLTIMAPNNFQFVDGYGPYPKSLCGTDKDTESLYHDRAVELGVGSKNLAIIYDILDQKPPQIGNPMKEQCEEAMEVFHTSTNKTEDLKFCGGILLHTKTRKCISDANEMPIEVFMRCFRYRIFGHVSDCEHLKNLAISCGNDWKGPIVVC